MTHRWHKKTFYKRDTKFSTFFALRHQIPIRRLQNGQSKFVSSMFFSKQLWSNSRSSKVISRKTGFNNALCEPTQSEEEGLVQMDLFQWWWYKSFFMFYMKTDKWNLGQVKKGCQQAKISKWRQLNEKIQYSYRAVWGLSFYETRCFLKISFKHYLLNEIKIFFNLTLTSLNDAWTIFLTSSLFRLFVLL